jgi:8-oxo-dGTP pyrophosphatase MutT (NUDIX family)
MTIDEKNDLLSLNFTQIWYRVWRHQVLNKCTYFVARNKFMQTFTQDNGARLKKLIGASRHSNRFWEIPKGRKKGNSESALQCAIREFGEETGVDKSKYRILNPSTPRRYSYIDDGVRYTNYYYTAYCPKCSAATFNFNITEQIGEIADMQWMGITGMRLIDIHGHLQKTARTFINYTKKHITAIE